jgi:cystathionine gamma-lyase
MPSDSSRWKPATRVLHAGLPEPAQGQPFLPGPAFAAPFHLSGDPESSEYVYARYGNPTWTAFEGALGELEGGEALVFSSGMAAAASVLIPAVGPDEVLVVPEDCFAAVRGIAAEHGAARGAEVRVVPSATEAMVEAAQGAKLVWVETPTNPALNVVDIAAVAEAVHGGGGLLAVDNTLATPLAQRPLDLGADISMASATKHISGHSDVILGYVVVRDGELVTRLRDWRTQTGSIAAPFEVWLAHRSLATLALRVERQCATALALAEFLVGREDVTGVRYPGLPNHPDHLLAQHQMSARYGSVIGFDLGSEARAQAFLSASELVFEATSFGGVHSSAERRARWRVDAVPEGFIRFSAGLEDPDDLLADVERALEAGA